jgi:hypothetical protein
MEFLTLSSIDFFGGGGGISSVPWCAGSACQVSFASRYLSEMRSRIWARDIVPCVPTISAALPASWSARSLPGVPACPFTQTGSTVLFLVARLKAVTHLWMRTACSWPGPAPVWPTLAMALVQCKHDYGWSYHFLIIFDVSM